MSTVCESNPEQTGRILYLGAPISLRDGRVMAGCNTYFSSTVVCQSADFGVLADETSRVAGAGFAQTFVDRFRGLESFVPHSGVKDEFVDALSSATGVGFQEVLLEAILAVENAIAFAMHDATAVAYAAIRRRETESDLIWSSDVPKLSLASAGVGLLGLIELLPIEYQSNRSGDATGFKAAFAALTRQAGRRRLAPPTAAIKLAARRHGIVCDVLGRQQLLLGQGAAQQHVHVSLAETSPVAAQDAGTEDHDTARCVTDSQRPAIRILKVGMTDAATGTTERSGGPAVMRPSDSQKRSGFIVEFDGPYGPATNAHPMRGELGDLAAGLVRQAFPAGNNGRIPILVVAGDNGTGWIARVLDAVLRGAGHSVALALRNSAFVEGRPAGLTEAQQTKAPLVLLRDPNVDTLVATVSLRQAARRGLQLNDCTVAVLLDRAKTGAAEMFHAGLDVVDRATSDCVVVGSGNRLALQRISPVKGRRVILVGERPNDPGIRAHIDAGHDVVTTAWHDGEVCISLMSGDRSLANFRIDDAIAGKDKLSRKRLTSVLMFAIGAAHGAGMSSAAIRAALGDARVVDPPSD